MSLLTFSRPVYRLIFQFTYSSVAMICLIWLAIALQAGSSGLYLFLLNDLLTNPQALAFVLGFPIAYLTALIIQGWILRFPRFDYFNRILAINLIVYSFLGLALSILRLPFSSREVFVTEFLFSFTLLLTNYILSHRLYPKRLGVLQQIDITPFDAYPSLEVIAVNAETAKDSRLDGIVANLRGVADHQITYLLTELAQLRIPVYDANTLIEILWGRVPLADLTPAEIDSFTPPIIYGVFKRAGELVLILLCLPFLSIVYLIISISIKLDSPGPVLFSQPRTGLNGTTFTILKFRSMFITNDQEDRFAEKDDKRITRVGRVLRRFRQDELPQLWNVIKGDMSLIGPRPEQVEFTKRFEKLIPFYGYRHTIRPGITGWAQVMYGYAASDEQTRAKLELDFFYIKHMSAWMDLVVLVKTIHTIVLGKGVR